MILVAHDSHSQATPYTLTQLEQAFCFRYLSHLSFDHYETEQWIKKQCASAHKRHMIDSLVLWLGQLHHAILEGPSLPDITLRWVNDVIRYGIFTNRPIKQWECIGEYTGIVRRRGLLKRDVNDYCFRYPQAWISWKPYTLDSEQQGNFTRFINHSDNPNLEALSVFYGGVFHVILRAVCDIPAGSELRYDYGEDYWRKRQKQ